MDLPPDTVRGFELLVDPKKIPDNAYSELLTIAFGVITSTTDEKAIADSKILSALDALVLKQAYATVVSLTFEIGKLDMFEGIQEYLVEQGFSEQRASLFVSLYTKSLRPLRNVLGSVGFNFDHIVDVAWRVDFLVKSDMVERVNVPTFFIKFKTKGLSENSEGIQSKNVEFTATLEQMQFLVAKLKDATASMERLDMFQ